MASTATQKTCEVCKCAIKGGSKDHKTILKLDGDVISSIEDLLGINTGTISKGAVIDGICFKNINGIIRTARQKSDYQNDLNKRLSTPQRLKCEKLHIPPLYENYKYPKKAKIEPFSASPSSKKKLNYFHHPVHKKSTKQDTSASDWNLPKPIDGSPESFDNDAMVKVKYPSGTKTRYADKGTFRHKLLSILCKTADSDSNSDDNLFKRIANAVYSESRCTPYLQSRLFNDLDKETSQLCKSNVPSILRQTGPCALDSISKEDIFQEWSSRAPLLHKCLGAITNTKEFKEQDSAVAFAGSMLLFTRNKHMSRMQHAVGLILDSGGLKNEALDIMNKLSICTSKSSILSKKHELLRHNDISLPEICSSVKSVKEDSFTDTKVVQNCAMSSEVQEVEAGALRTNGHVMIEERLCKIEEIFTSRTGEHGNAKLTNIEEDFMCQMDDAGEPEAIKLPANENLKIHIEDKFENDEKFLVNRIKLENDEKFLINRIKFEND